MAFFYIIYCFATQISLVHGWSIIEEELSAAAGNLTTLKTKIASPWVQGPNFRGTPTILWSCIVTLTACIYTAIHLNIPPAHEGKWHLIWRKAKWVGLALLAPEIVLYCAYSQFAEARKLVKELNGLRGAEGDVEGIREDSQDRMTRLPLQKFPLKYGFLVVMGGIATPSVTKITDDPNPPQTLGPNAILLFARRGFFFDVSSDEIMDKSKANMLGKALICLQVIWFAVQIIARTAAGYPLTLIEIHTMVHVLCALAMYILWWEKPHNVLESVARDIPDHFDLLAALYVMVGSSFKEKEAFKLLYYGTLNAQHQTQDQAAFMEYYHQSRQVVIIDPGGKDLCTLFGRQALHSLIGPDSQPKDVLMPRYLSAKDVRRWNCLAKLLRQSGLREDADMRKAYRLSTYDADETDSSQGMKVFYLLDAIDKLYTKDDNLVFHQPNFRKHKRGDFFEIILVTIAMPILSFLNITLPIAYGGIHLAAWSFQFASNIERQLWKIACIIIMTTFIVLKMMNSCFTSLENSIESPNKSSLKRMFNFLSEKVTFVLLIFYGLSRVYLLVESFISLRHAPIGVFATVPWVQSIPHI